MSDKVKIITESLSNVKYIQEGEGSDKELFIEGIFSTADIENKNGRKYRKETLKRQVESLQEDIKKNRLFGELNHPDQIQVDPERYAILIKELKWEDGNIKGKAKVLGTPLGNIIKAVIDAGGAIGISSRGTGTVDEDGYVNDKNYKLITWDVVGNPSNSPSWMNGIYEGKEWEVSEDGQILKEHVLIPEENIITEEKNSSDLLESLSKLVVENKISEDTIAEKVKEIVSALNKESLESINENLSSTIKKALDECSNNSQEIKKIVKEAVVEAFDEIQKSVVEDDCKDHKEHHDDDDDEKKKGSYEREVPVGNKPGDFSTEDEDDNKKKKLSEEEIKEAKKLFVEHLLSVAKKALKK